MSNQYGSLQNELIFMIQVACGSMHGHVPFLRVEGGEGGGRSNSWIGWRGKGWRPGGERVMGGRGWGSGEGGGG